MYKRLSDHNGVFRLPPIQRKSDKELDMAIADLEKRGFRLVRRGTQKEQALTLNCYKNCTTFNKVWAVMEKLMQ
ncbi:hypothetical protein CSE16_08840 [Solibacillus sp. R5-41]|uniref:hypothetical protein n=1 Tax=Solibacillus sp. R5-41 TaxID=2048654 RepID=UPI000C125558|nr:hypothetical protein [Solibacillus sp. R5-41]ATP40146.1 hypothetical protein CSE16_08840 [Solibacillus sp. R5-41]